VVAGNSRYHLIRQFRRYTGLTPKQYLEDLTLKRAKLLLDESATVKHADFQAGLSGSARLHDHFVSLEAVTPREHKLKGRELVIRYDQHPTPFDNMFLAEIKRGVCALIFIEKDDLGEAMDIALSQWPQATLIKDQQGTENTASRVFSANPGAGGLHLIC
jgi:AraC family transcriptional regulator of adaptative response/methylated-DNA-[protein]-cysteine methyltransferase